MRLTIVFEIMLFGFEFAEWSRSSILGILSVQLNGTTIYTIFEARIS